MYAQPNMLLMIKRRIPGLNPALGRIARFVVKYPQEVKSMTIKQLAEKCEISQATITKFVREMGLGGYQELKIAIAETLSAKDSDTAIITRKASIDDIAIDDTLSDIINKVNFHTVQILKDTKELIDFHEIERAIRAIEKRRDLIFLCMGLSTVAAESAVFRFLRVGKFCVLYSDLCIQAISTVSLPKDSVVIGISNSGTSIPTIKGLEIAQSRGATTICITSFKKSPIVKYADIKLITAATSPFLEPSIYDESTISIISQLLMLDIIYALYATRNYKTSLSMLEKTWSSFEGSKID